MTHSWRRGRATTLRNLMHSAALNKLQILKLPKEIVKLDREVARMLKKL